MDVRETSKRDNGNVKRIGKSTSQKLYIQVVRNSPPFLSILVSFFYVYISDLFRT